MPRLPLVSVVMPVYNKEKYLREAIESILNQTFTDFEFIIVNDGSTDGSREIIKKYGRTDDRIRVYEQENRGVIVSRNRGCRLARGKYVAFMDADDISMPERLAREAEYLDAHPDVGVVDPWVEHIDEDGNKTGEWRTPTSHYLIKWYMFFENPLRQSSVMVRRDVLDSLGWYKPDVIYVEDYYLWMRAVEITKFAAIPEFLSRIRYYEESRSCEEVVEKRQFIDKMIHSMVTRQIGRDIPIESVKPLFHMNHFSLPKDIGQIRSTAELVVELCLSFLESNPMGKNEALMIKKNASDRILGAARLAWEISPPKGLLIAGLAVRIYPKWLFSRLAPNALKRVVRKAQGFIGVGGRGES